MKKVIFHLGTYKTGTSSIQNHLFDHRAQLLERGILYPTSVTSAQRKTGHRHSEMFLNFRSLKDDATPQRLIDEIEASNADILILSSEVWSSPFSLRHLMRVVNDLKAMGYGDALGVLYLRNIADYRVSFYREMTCNQRNKLPYNTYISGRLGLFDYQFLVRFYRALFGDKLQVLAHEGTDSVRAFRDIVGASLFDGIALPDKRFNTKSVDAVDVEIFRLLNAAGMSHDLAQKVRDSLAPALQTTDDWTERQTGDHEMMPSGYATDLAALIGWPLHKTELLLQDAPIRGMHVSHLSDAIRTSIKELKAEMRGAKADEEPKAPKRDRPSKLTRWFKWT
ncbi:hypothetical protein MUY21_12215 [Aliiroseovarius sp. S2029]|uniref:hypothetical protein n=1 Tax=Aliiroseovarius sp. S2029 TaxID=2936988 RepID=UPI0020BF0BB9|nr:hypothetical protein [Aliiroseovarius sp. S2029]MCK8484803.1 hypothetical protein [Aliiroseovarius sp. S2029]